MLDADGEPEPEVYVAAHGSALDTPKKVAMARPNRVRRADNNLDTIPIEGRDEWLAAARRLA